MLMTIPKIYEEIRQFQYGHTAKAVWSYRYFIAGMNQVFFFVSSVALAKVSLSMDSESPIPP